MTEEALPRHRREELARPATPGRVKVLAVGVDDYAWDGGFAALSTCRNDALEFADCFRDVPQLDADPAAITTLVSRGSARPSRGSILGALARLVQSAGDGDRLVFYFSGHGHRIAGDPEFYLVPEDAYSGVDPTSLIPFSRVTELLRGARAEQKLVFLDVCPSGRSASRVQSPGAPLSRQFLDEVMNAAPGLVILSSSAEDSSSSTKSPNPQHSLLTTYLLQALRGASPGALDGRLLTIPSLHQFLSLEVSRWAKSRDLSPMLHPSSGGSVVLADFSGPLLDPDVLATDGGAFKCIELANRGRPVALKQILTALRRNYTPAYLEQKANDALGGYLAEELGAKVPRLRARFKWSSAAVHVEGRGITFPDGHYEARYVASTEKQGTLTEHLSLEPVWLERPGHLAGLLEALELDPGDVTFFFRKQLALGRFVPQLESRGWRVTSELAHRLEACNQGCVLVLEPDSLTLSELPLRELFAEEPDEDAVRAAKSALALLGGA